MPAFILRFACFMLLFIHLDANNKCIQCMSNCGQSHGDDHQAHRLNLVELEKFAKSFNISTTSARNGLCQVSEVDITSDTGAMVERYFKNSNAHGFKIKIRKIFSIRRKYEEQIFAQWNDDKEHLLLWHGTKLKNLERIVEDGLTMPMPQYFDRFVGLQSAFVTTLVSMFGPGLFFADRASKSARYTDREGQGVLLLCEVALGKTYVFQI